MTPLTDLIGEDLGLIKKFVNMFFDSADSQMVEIETALFTDNQPELLRVLHGLRGEACAMGAQEFGALCRQMEKSLDQQAQALRLFAKMQAMLLQIKAQLRLQLGENPATAKHRANHVTDVNDVNDVNDGNHASVATVTTIANVTH